jgi:hypothetical protein
VDAKPLSKCSDCGCRLTVNYILCKYPTFPRKRTECDFSIETFSGDEDEPRKLFECGVEDAIKFEELHKLNMDTHLNLFPITLCTFIDCMVKFWIGKVILSTFENNEKLRWNVKNFIHYLIIELYT